MASSFVSLVWSSFLHLLPDDFFFGLSYMWSSLFRDLLVHGLLFCLFSGHLCFTPTNCSSSTFGLPFVFPVSPLLISLQLLMPLLSFFLHFLLYTLQPFLICISFGLPCFTSSYKLASLNASFVFLSSPPPTHYSSSSYVFPLVFLHLLLKAYNSSFLVCLFFALPFSHSPAHCNSSFLFCLSFGLPILPYLSSLLFILSYVSFLPSLFFSRYFPSSTPFLPFSTFLLFIYRSGWIPSYCTLVQFPVSYVSFPSVSFLFFFNS